MAEIREIVMRPGAIVDMMPDEDVKFLCICGFGPSGEEEESDD